MTQSLSAYTIGESKRRPDLRRPRCKLCGLPPHRYMFPTDLVDHHKPSEVACANSIIHLVEMLLGAECPRSLTNAITNLAFAAGSGSFRRGIREPRNV